MFSYSDRSLKLGDMQIDFASPIKDVLEIDNVLLVLLRRVGVKIDAEESMNRNVHAYNQKGDKLWDIQESLSGGDKDKPYTAIYFDSGDVVAYCGLGFEYSLNLKTGSVKPRGGRPW